MDRDEIICNCFNISAGDIEDAYNNGATTYEQLQDETSCGTACGSCEQDVLDLLEKLSK